MNTTLPKKILVVEDDADMRGGYEMVLENRCQATGVESAEEGLAILEKDPEGTPVMILDLFLPRMDGMEMLRIVKEKYPWMKVIVISPFAVEWSPQQCVRAGAFATLQKPFEMQNFYDTVEKAFETYEKEKFGKEKKGWKFWK